MLEIDLKGEARRTEERSHEEPLDLDPLAPELLDRQDRGVVSCPHALVSVYARMAKAEKAKERSAPAPTHVSTPTEKWHKKPENPPQKNPRKHAPGTNPSAVTIIFPVAIRNRRSHGVPDAPSNPICCSTTFWFRLMP